MATANRVTSDQRAVRTIVCLPDPALIAPPIARALAAVGWRLEPLRRGRAPSALRLDDDVQAGTAGLIVVAGTLDAELEALLPELLRSPTVWIAILDRDDLERPVVRDLVADYCYDFLTLPLDPERLRFGLGHLSGMASLIRTQLQHRRAGTLVQPAGPEEDGEGPGRILGHCASMTALREDIAKLAASDYPVLVQGESGTGKELAARAIHASSARREAPFVAVNCASLSPSLIHAELFGHERGAFTGATQQHKGHLEAAHRGTILLDEIGDLGLELQLLLLRFLDQGTLQRVGGCRTIAVDARIIAATHVDLERSVREGRFREDLYYRLNVLALNLPPLRDRGDDAEVLACRFLARFGAAGEPPRALSACARLAIRSHRWPGNVRELINRVRRALVMSPGGPITARDLGLAADVPGATRSLLPRTAVRDDAERALVCKALEDSRGHAAEAASLIGVSRATFYRMMERHGVMPMRSRPPVSTAAANDGLVRPGAGLPPAHPAAAAAGHRDPSFGFPPRDAG